MSVLRFPTKLHKYFQKANTDIVNLFFKFESGPIELSPHLLEVLLSKKYNHLNNIDVQNVSNV